MYAALFLYKIYKQKPHLSVPRPRLELGTNSLKGYCSTIELPGHAKVRFSSIILNPLFF